jgi:hypothetical protein
MNAYLTSHTYLAFQDAVPPEMYEIWDSNKHKEPADAGEDDATSLSNKLLYGL